MNADRTFRRHNASFDRDTKFFTHFILKHTPMNAHFIFAQPAMYELCPIIFLKRLEVHP